MRVIRTSGLGLDPVEVDGQSRRGGSSSPSSSLSSSAPRAATRRTRVEAEAQERPAEEDRLRTPDFYDEANGISAMERRPATLSITGQLQATGRVERLGVATPDQSVPADVYVNELAERGVRIRRTD